MIKELKEIDKGNIKSIRMEWFYTENGLLLEKKAVQYDEYDIDLSANKLIINQEYGILRFVIDGIDEDGKESIFIIRQNGNDITIKSDSFDDGLEGVEHPLNMYISNEEIVFVCKDEYERQFIYVKLRC